MSSENKATGNEGALYCAHCGTKNAADAYSCDRCGERVYIPDPKEPPPLGFAECPKCLTANESRSSYCARCGSSMANAARISVFGGAERARQAPHTTPGGIRISPRSRDAVRTGRRPPIERPEADRTAEAARRAARQREEQERQRQAQAERERDQREWARANAREREQKAAEPDPGVNDSGTRSARLPGAARGWNTAAFLIGPIWGPANGVWLGVIGLIFLAIPADVLPWFYKVMLYFVFGAYLGLKGNEMAWRARRWNSVAHFRQVQQMWMVASLIVSIILFLVLVPIASGS